MKPAAGHAALMLSTSLHSFRKMRVLARPGLTSVFTLTCSDTLPALHTVEGKRCGAADRHSHMCCCHLFSASSTDTWPA